jgi:hypothetical protein
VAELADTAAAELAGIATHDPDAALVIEAEVLSASRHTVTAALWNAQRLRAWRGRLGDRRPGERLLLANVASQIALDGGCAADAAQAALRALRGGRLLEEQTADAMPVYQAVWVLTAAERLRPAQAVLDQALDRATRSGSPVGFALASLFRSYLELARGDLPRAEAEAQSALDAAFQLPGGWFALPAVVAGLLDVLVERDRLDDGRRLLERTGTAADLPDSTPARLLLCSRGRLRLALGRVEEAVGDVLELERRERQWHVLATHLVPRHETAAAALAAAGDLRGAHRHARLGVQAARRWGAARTIARALRARASLEPPATAAATLGQAVALLEGSPAGSTWPGSCTTSAAPPRAPASTPAPSGACGRRSTSRTTAAPSASRRRPGAASSSSAAGPDGPPAPASRRSPAANGASPSWPPPAAPTGRSPSSCS